MKTPFASLAAVLAIGILNTPIAHAGALVVFKLGSLATGGNAISGDEYTFWANNGGFNEGNGTAASLSNTTLDYKDSWVDSALNWSTVLGVNVGMYVSGVEVVSLDFSPSSSKTAFFASGNRTASTYSDLAAFSGNFFSEVGDSSYNRRWFVNNNYGGCGSDQGWMVVEDASSSKPCSWESTRTNGAGRAFLYTTGGTMQNWNTSNVGVADVFAVTVTTAGSSATPEPATLSLVGAALLGLGARLRRHRRRVR